MPMTSRERVLTACRRGKPDRIPRQIPMLWEVHQFLQGALREQDVHAYLRDDTGWVGYEPTVLKTDYSRYFDRTMEWDEWGRGRVWDAERHYAEYFYPLQQAESIQDILDYPWPDMDQEYRYVNSAAQAAAVRERGLPVCGGPAETVFEIAWQLRSMEMLFEDMAYRPDMAITLLDRITDQRVFTARKIAQAGADILHLGDDVAMQTGLMMSRKTWRVWFGSRLKRVIDAAKAAKPDIIVFYHSDGAITDLIPDLIEAGVEILNPVQPECVDHAWVKKTYGDRLAFWGGLGVQSVLPFGTPTEVREHVRTVIEALGHDGGFVVGPSHVLETDTPIANIIAMKEAIDEYGQY